MFKYLPDGIFKFWFTSISDPVDIEMIPDYVPFVRVTPPDEDDILTTPFKLYIELELPIDIYLSLPVVSILRLLFIET